jgi:hypothetical protein
MAILSDSCKLKFFDFMTGILVSGVQPSNGKLAKKNYMFNSAYFIILDLI